MIKENVEVKIGRCTDCPLYATSVGRDFDMCMFPGKIKHFTDWREMHVSCPLKKANLTIKYLPKNQRRKKKVYPE